MQLKPEQMRWSYMPVKRLNIIDAIIMKNEQMNVAGNNDSGDSRSLNSTIF